MKEETEKLPIIRVTERGKSRLEDVVVGEFSLTANEWRSRDKDVK